MAFVKAERKRAKARVAFAGPSGSGKSYSALLFAKGLGGKIAAIDTEHGSLSMYSHLVDFDVCELDAPFSPERYIAMIHEAEKAGYDVIVIDSITHEWTGEGGILSAKDHMPGTNERDKWRQLTPKHDGFINAMLQSPCHVVVTMRSKTAYVEVEKQGGGKRYEKKGMEPQQRDGMEYEFTVMFDIDQDRHIASASKDRTTLFDGKYETITEKHGSTLREWLDSGAAPTQAAKPNLPEKCPDCGCAFDAKQAEYAHTYFGDLCKKCFEAKEKGKTANGGDVTIREPGAPATEKQRGMLAGLFKEKGFSELAEDNWLQERYSVGSKTKLTKGQASDAISALQQLPDKQEESGSLGLEPPSGPTPTEPPCTGDPNTCEYAATIPGDPAPVCAKTGAVCGEAPSTGDPFAE
ncbi:MAG: ATP-binding protein [Armatimonadetes bacterium]|nr:ATP-binding protein [Armatimonadota bacterium]